MANSSAIQLGDLALVWSDAQGSADLLMIDNDLASERGLVTAAVLSLFTDARAKDDDKPPSGHPDDRRGWWADEFAEVEGDKYGSRLWLLDRSTLSNESLRRADEYIREALAWMIEDRVVASIDVTITKVAPNRADVEIGLQRPSGDGVTFRFTRVWDHLQEDV